MTELQTAPIALASDIRRLDLLGEAMGLPKGVTAAEHLERLAYAPGGQTVEVERGFLFLALMRLAHLEKAIEEKSLGA